MHEKPLTNILREWCHTNIPLHDAPVPTVSMLVADVLPISIIPFDTSFLIAKLIMWIFAVDDLVDNGHLSIKDLETQLSFWRKAVREQKVTFGNADALTNTWFEIMDELRYFPAFKDLKTYWEIHLTRLIMAMKQEMLWNNSVLKIPERQPPTLNNYLHTSMYSIGLPITTTMVQITVSHEKSKLYSKSLLQAVKTASIAIRLLNDFQSAEREIKENKLNAAILFSKEITNKNNLLDQNILKLVKQKILSTAEFYAKRCFIHLSHNNNEENKEIQHFLYKVVKFNLCFYRNRDHNRNF